MSKGRVPGGWSSNRKSVTCQFCVYARNDQHRMNAEPGSVPAGCSNSEVQNALVSEYLRHDTILGFVIITIIELETTHGHMTPPPLHVSKVIRYVPALLILPNM